MASILISELRQQAADLLKAYICIQPSVDLRIGYYWEPYDFPPGEPKAVSIHTSGPSSMGDLSCDYDFLLSTLKQDGDIGPMMLTYLPHLLLYLSCATSIRMPEGVDDDWSRAIDLEKLLLAVDYSFEQGVKSGLSYNISIDEVLPVFPNQQRYDVVAKPQELIDISISESWTRLRDYPFQNEDKSDCGPITSDDMFGLLFDASAVMTYLYYYTSYVSDSLHAEWNSAS